MKKYTVTVIDNETGKPAEVEGKPIQAETDVLLIAWGEENGVRKVGLNQKAWAAPVKRASAVGALMEMAENLCGGEDTEGAVTALSTVMYKVTELLAEALGPKNGAKVAMTMAEELAKKACMEKEAEV